MIYTKKEIADADLKLWLYYGNTEWENKFHAPDDIIVIAIPRTT
jgi:hypothetical protein